jgi:hypothetical protein
MIALQIGALSTTCSDSADFADLLDASDAAWRAATTLDRIVQSEAVSATCGHPSGLSGTRP